MPHRVNREEFIQTLARVAPGLSSRDWLEQSTCVVIQDGWCSTFNDEICCRTKSSLPPEISGAVRALPLTRALENLTDDEVEVSCEKGKLRVTAARTKVWVRMENSIVLPVDRVIPPKSWTPLPQDFKDAVELVVAGAGTNEEEFLSVCVHLHPEYMESTDRRQMTRYAIETGVSGSFLVRAKSLAHLVSLQPVKMGETENWVHFRNKSVIFSCRRHLDPFPTETLTRALRFKGVPTKLPMGAEVAAKLAGVFSGEDKKKDRVRVDLTDGHMTVTGEGAYGGATRDLDMDYHGDDLSFQISPTSLIELVKRDTECEIGDGKLKVLGERWSYLTVLSRGGVETPAGGEVKDEPEPVSVAAGDDEGDE